MTKNKTKPVDFARQVAQAARQMERERITEILTSEHADGRWSQALHLALKSETRPELAIELLAAGPRSNMYDDVMKGERPGVGFQAASKDKRADRINELKSTMRRVQAERKL